MYETTGFSDVKCSIADGEVPENPGPDTLPRPGIDLLLDIFPDF
jgi:hypothetical protein